MADLSQSFALSAKLPGQRRIGFTIPTLLISTVAIAQATPLAAYLSIGATLAFRADVRTGAVQAAISSGKPSTDSTEQFSLLAS
jgi:hypothetical protein